METLLPTEIGAAPSVQNFLDRLKAENLVPMQVSPEDLIQRVNVTHNAGTGQFEWKAEKIGEQAIGLLAFVLADMWRYWFKQPLRPPLTSGHAKVCIDLNGDTLSMSFGLVDPERPDAPPVADPLVAATMMAAALFFLFEKVNGGDFNPMDALLGKIQRKDKAGEW